MKTLLQTLFICLLFISAANAQQDMRNSTRHHDSTTCPYTIQSEPVLKSGMPGVQSVLPVISFEDFPYNHNMHITSDETYYYTINGGSASYGQVSVFDLFGNLIQTYPIAIDGRGISMNKTDGYLYVSTFGGDIVRIDDLAAGTFTTVFSGIMQNCQASFAISTDGTLFYDFYAGTLLVRDFNTGLVLNTIMGLAYGNGNYGGEEAVAVDASHIFTWDATLQTVYVYDLAGGFIQTLPLDSGDNGISLSIANNLLFVSRDGNYAVGTWYGYSVSSIGTGVDVHSDPAATMYPNPTTGKISLDGKSVTQIEIFNSTGGKIYSCNYSASGMTHLDFDFPEKGIYLARIYYGDAGVTQKIVVQ